MIDHLSLAVRDLARSREFYAQALAPLGAAVQMEYEGGLGIGWPGKPAFWLSGSETPTSATHVAFIAPDRASVDAFHAAALAAGGKDNGPPGLRPHYHPSYYAAFVIDPDGHNVEAVCHVLEGGARKRAAGGAAAKRATPRPAAKRRGGRPTAKRAAARKSGRGSTGSARRPSRKGSRKATR
jgi:catechol 2,3-dioxygenase-like lactoylglutathione lyase family enzyme